MADQRIGADPVVQEKEVGLQNDEKKTASEVIFRHGLDADEAMKAFIGHEGERIVLDEATNRRLLRKIDIHILPVRLILCWQAQSGLRSSSFSA